MFVCNAKMVFGKRKFEKVITFTFAKFSFRFMLKKGGREGSFPAHKMRIYGT